MVARTRADQDILKARFDTELTAEQKRIETSRQNQIAPIQQKIEEVRNRPNDQFPNKGRDILILERQVQRITEATNLEKKQARDAVGDRVFGRNLNVSGGKVSTESKESLQRKAEVRIAERQVAIKRSSSTRTIKSQRDFIRAQAKSVESDGSEVGKARASALREGLRVERKRTRDTNPATRNKRFSEAQVVGKERLRIRAAARSKVKKDRADVADPLLSIQNDERKDFQRTQSRSFFKALDKRGVKAKDLVPRQFKNDTPQGVVIGGFSSVDGTSTIFIAPTNVGVSIAPPKVTKKVEGGFAFTNVQSNAPFTSGGGASLVTQDINLISNEDAQVNRIVTASLFPTTSSRKAEELFSNNKEFDKFEFKQKDFVQKDFKKFNNEGLDSSLNRRIEFASDIKAAKTIRGGSAISLNFISPIENIFTDPTSVTVSEGGKDITFTPTTKKGRQERTEFGSSEVLQSDFSPSTTEKIVKARRQRIDATTNTATLGGILPQDPLLRENVFSVLDVALGAGSISKAGSSAARRASVITLEGSDASISALGKSGSVGKFTIVEEGFGALPAQRKIGTTLLSSKGTGFENIIKVTTRSGGRQVTNKGRLINELNAEGRRVDLLQIGDDNFRLSTITQAETQSGKILSTGIQQVKPNKFFGKSIGQVTTGTGISDVGAVRIGVGKRGATLRPKTSKLDATILGGKDVTRETFGKSKGIFERNSGRGRRVTGVVSESFGLGNKPKGQIINDLLTSKKGSAKLKQPKQIFKPQRNVFSNFDDVRPAAGRVVAERSVRSLSKGSNGFVVVVPSTLTSKSAVSLKDNLFTTSFAPTRTLSKSAQQQQNIFAVTQKQGQNVIQDQVSKSALSFNDPLLTSPVTRGVSTGFNNSVPPSTRIPPLVPPFAFGLGGGSGKGVVGKKGKRKTLFSPDLASLNFGSVSKKSQKQLDKDLFAGFAPRKTPKDKKKRAKRISDVLSRGVF